MKSPVDFDVAQVRSIYIVANTPAYLYKHLQRHAVVAEIGEIFRASAIGEALRALLSAPNRTYSDVARAYALLVALGRRPFEEWDQIVGSLDLSPLDWGEAIVRMMRSVVPTLVSDVRMSMQLPTRIESTKATSSEMLIRSASPRIIITDV
jgi:hypothetical protein